MNDTYFLPLFVSSGLLLIIFIFFLITYLLIQKKKQNKYQMEKSRMIYTHQNKLLLTRFEEQERTLVQMSKEIHDNVGQMLNFIKMNLTVIGRYATRQEQALLIEKTKTMIDSLHRDVHNLSHTLNTDFIRQRGLVGVLHEELEYMNISNSVACNIDIVGNVVTLDPDKELLIYRIAQEAMHNISKHSQASAFSIQLIYEQDTFLMRIADNGIGFNKNKIYELNGIGFMNMLQRAKLLNGHLDINSEPLHGCTITLRLNDIKEPMQQH